MDSGHKTAKYKLLPEADGAVRVQFFCDLSGALACTTKPIATDTDRQALEIAWETEGREQFNLCRKCGRFISDVMFNADVHECVACAPWEDQPNYCPHCGRRIIKQERLCPSCRQPLLYEGM